MHLQDVKMFIRNLKSVGEVIHANIWELCTCRNRKSAIYAIKMQMRNKLCLGKM